MKTEIMIQKYGSEAAYKRMLAERGRKGGLKTAALGKSGTKHMTKQQRSAYGKLGYAAMVKKLKEG